MVPNWYPPTVHRGTAAPRLGEQLRLMRDPEYVTLCCPLAEMEQNAGRVMYEGDDRAIGLLFWWLHTRLGEFLILKN